MDDFIQCTTSEKIPFRYIFSLYKMSPVWLVTSGVVIAFVIGYVASYIIGKGQFSILTEISTVIKL